MVKFEAQARADTPPFNPVQLANTFVSRYGKDNAISHLKLQKLCYFAYGWWLGVIGDRLTTVGPQVWKLGPVFQPIYTAFAGFRDGSITEPQPISIFTPSYTIEATDQRQASEFVDWIWSRYGHYSGIALSNKTHEPGTPWYQEAAKHSFVIPRFTELPDEQIRTYFQKVALDEGLFIQAS